MNRSPIAFVLLAVLVCTLLVACGTQDTGTLRFHANGEDFVRQGFVSKDGWAISFAHVYVSLADIEGYQTDPPYDPHDGGKVQARAEMALDGSHTVDLAEGGPDADPILVGQVTGAPVGHYNASSWRMVKAESGPASGSSLVVVGSAEKEGQTVDFTIQVDTEYEYTCGEYVGDERKGILETDGTADLEMTFHFDHIYGDAGTPPDDELNLSAVGFEPFAAIVGGSGTLQTDMAGLQASMTPDAYQMLVSILPTLGHVGEGHCHSEVQ